MPKKILSLGRLSRQKLIKAMDSSQTKMNKLIVHLSYSSVTFTLAIILGVSLSDVTAWKESSWPVEQVSVMEVCPAECKASSC